MHKNLTLFFLFFWFSFNGSLVFAEGDTEYRFERMWPRLEQPWYFNQPHAVAVAPDGSVYVADTGNNRIQQFDAEGGFIRLWGTGGSENGQFDSPKGVGVAQDGSVYVSDTGNDRIQQFSASGDFIRSWGSQGSEDANLSDPRGLAIAPDGSIYVADFFNNTIKQYSAEGVFIRTIGRSSYGASTKELGELWRPIGVAVAQNGSIYVIDDDRIQQFHALGEVLRGRSWSSSFGVGAVAIAPDGSIYVTDMFSITHFSAKFEFIHEWRLTQLDSNDGAQGLAIDSSGSIYIAGTRNNRIQKFSAEGDLISTWASSGFKEGELNAPSKLAVAPNGNIYVADTENHRVQQFNAKGEFVRAWGGQGRGSGEFSFPRGIAVSMDGDVYVSDTFSKRIQKFSADGDFIQTIEAGSGAFIRLAGIAISLSGNIYVADTGNNHILAFTPEGVLIRTIKFNGGTPSNLAVASDGSLYVVHAANHAIAHMSIYGDSINSWGGKGSAEGQFMFPSGIEVATDGSIYITDSGNNRIQKFSAEGEFISAWGAFGSGDGQLNSPEDLAIGLNGEIFIADTENHRIQKFSPRSKTNVVATTPDTVTITHPYKAILLAGGGEKIGGRTNHIWDGTWRVTQKAYKALSRQAFVIHDEIKFLTAGDTQIDLDLNNKFDDLEVANKESLRLAITKWAKDAKDVVIFLANHGGPGKFQINNTEILTGEELDSWVSELDESIPGTVTVIIEACNSASFFNQLSKSKRNLFASAKADQPAVISNGGLSSFSYFFWSEIGTGAYLQDAFRTARQAMSSITVAGLSQDAQADTDGNKVFNKQDLDNLAEYCLGNCNQTAAAAPVITPIAPNTRTLIGETVQDFSITVNHLQKLSRVWALVQRPDDISIDSNQALNFEKIILSCNDQDMCQGQYENFDKAGEYRLNFYAMDIQEEVSLPESITITQTQGKAVIPAVYDEQLAVIYLRDVEVDGKHLQAALELQGDKFVAIAVSEAPEQYEPAAKFDTSTGLLTIPHALFLGQDYQATFRYLGNLDFILESAAPR